MKPKILVSFLVIFIIILGAYTTLRTYAGSNDFDTYYYAAKAVLHGSSIYEPLPGLSPYIYPPLFACLLSPLAMLNIGTASILWYALNILFIFGCAFLCSFLVFGKSDAMGGRIRLMPFLPKALFLIVIAALLLDNISMLQVNIFLLLLTLLGLYFDRIGKSVLAGLFMSLSISIKIIPVLFLVYFALKNSWKALIWTLVFILIFSLALPVLSMGKSQAIESARQWYGNVFVRSVSSSPNYQLFDGFFSPTNQSPTAFAVRFLASNDYDISYWKNKSYKYPLFMRNWTLSLDRGRSLVIAKMFVFLLALFSFGAIAKKRFKGESRNENYEIALFFLLSLILNPLLKTQQLIFIAFPALIALSKIKIGQKGYELLYGGFVTFAAFYLLQGLKIFRILGFGAISVILLWLIIMILYLQEKAAA